MRDIVVGIGSFIAGALLLSLASIPQKLQLGVDYSDPLGYTVPVLFGGLSGLVIGLVYNRQRKAMLSVQGQRALLQEFLDHSTDLIQSVGPDGRFLYANRAWLTTLGYARDELGSLHLQDIVHPDHWPQCEWYLEKVLRGEEINEIETIFLSKDGRQVNIQGSARLRQDLAGVSYTQGIFRDTTRRKAAETTDRLMANVFETTAEGILITDPQARILTVNQAFTEVTGYSLEEIVGKSPATLKSGRHDEAFYRNMWDAINRFGHWQGEIWNRRKSGEIYPEWLTVSAVKDDSQVVTNYVGVFTDISILKRAEERLRYMATHDPLTDLPNRILFLDRLEHAIKRARRQKSNFAVLFLDLDNFKQVNDTFGHLQGDILLQSVGQRLSEATRRSDTVSRLGGDEFTILLEHITDDQTAFTVANKIAEALEEPFTLQGSQVEVSASIGFSIYPENGRTVNDLLRSADEAMYQAKSSSQSIFHLAAPRETEG